MKRRHLIAVYTVLLVILGGCGAMWATGYLDFFHPWWLLGLATIPLFIRIARRGRAGLPPHTNAFALCLRLVVILLIVACLADVQLILHNRDLCVFFLMDRSASIPDYIVDKELGYASDAAKTKRTNDLVGVSVFGENASIDMLARTVATRADGSAVLGPIRSVINRDYTNIEDAIKLTTAAFPANYRKKIVLMTDGNQNIGDIMEGVRQAVGDGIAIDVLPITYDYPKEVLIEKVYLPERIKENETFDLKVHIDSLGANSGILTITRNGVPVAKQDVQLSDGINTFLVSQKLTEPGFFTYTARISPKEDQIPQNNEASSYVYIQGASRVLLVANTALEAQYLAAACRSENLEADIIGPESLPDGLGGLQNHDCVVLCNVSAEQIPQGQTQMEMLRAAVRDLGIGLVMVGGANSFGAGDYQGTPIEDALPVTMDIRQKKIIPKGALALILHTCEFADGNYWAKQVSKEAIKTVNPQDEVGLIYYDYTDNEKWLFKLQPAENKGKLYGLIDGCEPGDMPSFVPPFQIAYDGLMGSDAMVKHMIVISDGDPASPTPEMIKNMAAANITVSTISINPHSPRDVDVLKYIARKTGGRYYAARSGSELPRIFIKEAKVVKRSLIFNEDFQPLLTLSTEITKGIRPEELPPLKAYVATTPKQRALVPIVSDNENHDPVLAYWHYGLGKAVAFTSDATSNWGEYWIEWDKYQKFWGQVIRWAARKREKSNLEISTQLDGNRGKLIIDAVDPTGNFINFLNMSARLVDPDNDGKPLDIRQTAPGRYEADFTANKVGINMLSVSYLDPKSGQQGFAATGVSVPYSPEYRHLQTDTLLLRQAAQLGGGKILSGKAEADAVFKSSLPPVRAFRPIWPWLAMVALVIFFLDITIRRVLITRNDLAAAWARVAAVFTPARRRGPRDETMSALLKKKQEVAARTDARRENLPSDFRERLEKAARSGNVESVVDEERASREAPPAAPSPRSAPAPGATTPEAKPPPAQDDSYTGRLLAAKRRARKKEEDDGEAEK